MARKLSYKFVAEAAFSYSLIEGGFSLVFNVPPERLKHLRGRIKHLMTLGLPESKPGKGARVTYGFDIILRWLMALLLEDIGVPPNVAVKAIRSEWERTKFDLWIQRAVDDESLLGVKDHPPNPVFMTLRPLLASSSWDERNPPLWIGFRRRYDWKIYERLKHDPDELKRFIETAAEDGTWACARNLTRDLTLLLDHLGGSSDGENKQ